ncbi:FAD-dependent monooxygenase [Xylanimonas oleitrophica]|uniref:FAD-dependent monooxygenase n=1 Tax=Xylanimonas oleitrophica TaxID=2607479 RepID=UPI0015D0509D|nr:FAD-dependent monooxygenase [Xylanimonas oleitrophica]
MQHLRVGIVGAGIAGLALAAGLRRDGHDVDLFEQAPSLLPVGAGISLSPDALRALGDLGLDDVVAAVTGGERATSAALLRPDGRQVLSVPARRLGLTTLSRAELHQALAGAAGEVRLGTEARVPTAGGPRVLLGDEEHAYDVVVAADGVRSRARAALGLDPGLRYAGWTSWRGVTREPFDLGGRMSESWGHGAMVGLVPLLDGRAYWFAAAKAPADGRVPEPRTEALARFGTWHAPVRAVIEATGAVVRTDGYDLARPLPTFVRGRVALVGDAAHAMTPNVGQGATQALLDVAALARGLRELHGVDEVLRTYDRRRRRHAQSVARASRLMGRVAMADGTAGRARDGALRLVPRHLARREAP